MVDQPFGVAELIPVAHGAGYLIYRRGGLPKAQAFFGAVPGGLIGTVVLDEEAGADAQTLILLQFLRGVRDGVILGAAAGIGYSVGRRMQFPAAIMTGPVLASAIVHLMGWTAAVPPGWAVAVTQVVLGSALGARFVGMERGALSRAFWPACRSVGVALILVFGFAFAVHGLVGQPVTSGFLALAPGGLAEMSLIAQSLKVGAVYVAVHHAVRIVVSVSMARLGVRWVRE